MRNNLVTILGISSCNFKGMCIGSGNVAYIIMVNFGYFVTELGPFNFLSSIPKHSCTLHDLVTVQNIFM